MQRKAWQRVHTAFALSVMFITPSVYANPIDGQDGMFVMASIGDSITTGFNAKNPLDNKSLNWSTGYSTSGKVNSHYWRVKNIYPGEVYQVNQAKAGAQSDAIQAQLESVISGLKGRELDYLTMMIGANDACAWPADHEERLNEFGTRVRATLERALAVNPDMKITLVPVPNMLRLYEVGKATFGCSARWKLMNICKNLLLNDDEYERAAFGERVVDLNRVLADIAADYPQSVHFAQEVATFEFNKEDISGYDCFHPSQQGQNQIAAKAWQGGWYEHMPLNELMVSSVK